MLPLPCSLTRRLCHAAVSSRSPQVCLRSISTVWKVPGSDSGITAVRIPIVWRVGDECHRQRPSHLGGSSRHARDSRLTWNQDGHVPADHHRPLQAPRMGGLGNILCDIAWICRSRISRPLSATIPSSFISNRQDVRSQWNSHLETQSPHPTGVHMMVQNKSHGRKDRQSGVALQSKGRHHR